MELRERIARKVLQQKWMRCKSSGSGATMDKDSLEQIRQRAEQQTDSLAPAFPAWETVRALLDHIDGLQSERKGGPMSDGLVDVIRKEIEAHLVWVSNNGIVGKCKCGQNIENYRDEFEQHRAERVGQAVTQWVDESNDLIARLQARLESATQIIDLYASDRSVYGEEAREWLAENK